MGRTGVAAAENRQEVSQTSMEQHSVDIKHLVTQETDENSVVSDNVNELKGRQKWPNNMFLELRKSEYSDLFEDTSIELSPSRGDATRSVLTDAPNVSADGLSRMQKEMDITKQDVPSMHLLGSGIGDATPSGLPVEVCLGLEPLVAGSAPAYNLHRSADNEDTVIDVAKGTARKDEAGILPVLARSSSKDSASIQQTGSEPSSDEVSSANIAAKNAQKYDVGQRVAYKSDTHQQWMQAVVKRVVFDSSGRVRCYDLDVKNGALESKIKGLKAFALDADVAEASDKVAPAEIVSSANVEDRCVVRSQTPTNDPSSKSEDVEQDFKIGDKVEYWSSTYNTWMAATVEGVRNNGTIYDLDVKRNALRRRIRKVSSADVADAPDSVPDTIAGTLGAAPSSTNAQVGVPGPVRQPWRRNSCIDAGAEVPVPATNQADNQTAESETAGDIDAAFQQFRRSKSPVQGRTKPACGTTIATSQYAHRPINLTAASAVEPPQRIFERGQSPISGRRRALSMDQPAVDGVDVRIGGLPQPQGVLLTGHPGKNAYTSPVLGPRSVIGDATGCMKAQTAQSGMPGVSLATATKQMQQEGNRVVISAPVSRQATGGTGADKSSNVTPSTQSSNTYLNSGWSGESASMMRAGGKVYTNPVGASPGAIYVSGNSSTNAAVTIRARSRSTGRNSLVPERIIADGAATPPRYTMQAHSSARQFPSLWPGVPVVGAQVPGSSGYNEGPRQLEVEDLAVGAGSFDPTQPSVRSQLIAKLHLPQDVDLEEMIGFRGGLNEGVWFLKAAVGASLVLKLVKGRRQHDTVPTEAEAFVKLSQEFSGIGSDASLSFPKKIFRCVRPDGTKVHDLIVMLKAPGKRLAEITAAKFHSKEVSLMMSIYERSGKLLREFHERYRGAQHGDFQPSNIVCDEDTGRITMIDVGGMARVAPDTDLQHFRMSMNILARSYGPELVATCLRYFQSGYDSMASNRS